MQGHVDQVARQKGRGAKRQPVVATTRTSSHPFIPSSPNRQKDPKSDMPEIEPSDPARSPIPKNQHLKKTKKAT
jgi:hypothetical protein